MSTIAESRATVPPPLAKATRHPWKWLENKFYLTVAGLSLGHIGMLVIVALYFIFWETNVFNPIAHLFGWHGTMKSLWHSMVSNSADRHNIRDVGEGFLGGMLGQMVIWNAYKKGYDKPPNLLDKLEIALRIPNIRNPDHLHPLQYPYGLLVAIIYGVPGFLAGTAIVNAVAKALHYAAPYVGQHSAYYQKILSIWTGSAPHVIIGLCASLFFARRPLRKVYDDIQRTLVDRRIALKKRVYVYHSPTFQARYNDRKENEESVAAAYRGHSSVVPIMLMVLIPVMLAGAIYGYYILTVVAVQGH
jgi:hypothetical protein